MEYKQGMKIVEFGFSIEEILKSVYAESAWRALRLDSPIARPAIISNDNKTVIKEFLMNSYVYLCSQLLGYVTHYDFDNPDSEIISLSIALPPQVADKHFPAIQKLLERAITCDLMGQCYNTQNYKAISNEYETEVLKILNQLRGLFLNPSFGNF